MYTDPDGEVLWFAPLIAIAISAAIAATTYTVNVAASQGGFQNWNWGQFAFSAMFGAVTGAFSFGVGATLAAPLTAAGISGFLGGAITGTVSGTVAGAMNGLVQASITGATGREFWKTFGISVGMGAGMGGLIGGIAGGIDAGIHHKNIWLGRDIGMGRNAFSFNNSDKPATDYFTYKRFHSKMGKENVYNITETLKNMEKYPESAHEAYKATRNITWANTEESSRRIYVGNMKGRGYLDYSGLVQDGCELQINFDGKNVLTLPSTDMVSPYPTTRMIIPSGTRSIDINYMGTPTIYGNPEEITHYPFYTIIYGISK
jgi:hypothetical protein